MSTKTTIAYDTKNWDFSLYTEMGEPDSVYLEIKGTEVEIPIEVWEYLRQFPVADMSLMGRSASDLEGLSRKVDAEYAAYVGLKAGDVPRLQAEALQELRSKQRHQQRLARKVRALEAAWPIRKPWPAADEDSPKEAPCKSST